MNFGQLPQNVAGDDACKQAAAATATSPKKKGGGLNPAHCKYDIRTKTLFDEARIIKNF